MTREIAPARDGDVAIREELCVARKAGTLAAYDLFIARHPGHRLAEIAAPYEVSLNAVSKHLMVLENAGLVTRRIEGRTHHLTLNPEPLRTAAQWLEIYRAFWEERLDALEDFIARKKGMERARRTSHHPKNRRHPR